jgi:hypothetical protein
MKIMSDRITNLYIKKDVCIKQDVFLRIEAKNHTPHSALHKGMFLGLHNSAHRSINITQEGSITQLEIFFLQMS